MSYDNFIGEFHTLEICHVPQTKEEKKKMGRSWEGVAFEGAWKVNVNAGGCINHLSKTF